MFMSQVARVERIFDRGSILFVVLGLALAGATLVLGA